MEKEAAKKLQLLGAFGIVREALNILLRSSRSKLLWAFSLTLLLPLTFASLGQNFVVGPLLLKIVQKQMEAPLHPGETTRRELGSEWRELVVVVAADIAFHFALWGLSTAAIVYTVASVYTADTTNLKLSYVRVLSTDVPGVWKRLTLTFLWFFIISFGFAMTSLLAFVLLPMIFFPTILTPPVGEKADHKLKSETYLFNVILRIVVVVFPQIYVSIVWYLASVVSVLEDKYYGLAAMIRSSNLMKGKRKTALFLFILINYNFGGIIVWLFVYAVVQGRSHGVGIATRAVSGTLLLGLHFFVNLMGMLTQSVLYFVCKSYHHESVEDNSSFKVYYVGDYEPLKTSSIQLKPLQADV